MVPLLACVHEAVTDLDAGSRSWTKSWEAFALPFVSILIETDPDSELNQTHEMKNPMCKFEMTYPKSMGTGQGLDWNLGLLTHLL